MIKAYKCKMCGYQTTSRGYRNAQYEIEEHFRKMHWIDDITGKDLVKAIESKPAKKWECPKCGKKMWYADKFHQKWWNKGFLIGFIFGLIMGAGWMLMALEK